MEGGISRQDLRKKTIEILKIQGYVVGKKSFALKNNNQETKREVHLLAKAERLSKNEKFIMDNIGLIKKNLINGDKLDISKINPKIIEVKEGSKYEKIFRWWNLVWWSLPYEHAYGRQMRFVVWDKYHKAPIGLIGLQSPILSWSVRDKRLGIKSEDRDYWVNQSMSAQRLGALPPYNYILGGKLVALLMTSDVIRKKFEAKYKDKLTVMQNRKLPARLLFITTTGAFGKSSVYNRLKFDDNVVSEFIGYTKGNGSFHIPNTLYEDFIKYLETRNYDVRRGYGSGPSKKLRLIDQAMEALGIHHGNEHGVKRALYLFSLVKNLEEVITLNKDPIWSNRSIEKLTKYWKVRWALPRKFSRRMYLNFSKRQFIEDTIKELKKYKDLQHTSKKYGQ